MYPWFQEKVFPSSKGVDYEAFGSLFSALAFIAVVAALIIQSQELKLQIIELQKFQLRQY